MVVFGPLPSPLPSPLVSTLAALTRTLVDLVPVGLLCRQRARSASASASARSCAATSSRSASASTIWARIASRRRSVAAVALSFPSDGALVVAPDPAAAAAGEFGLLVHEGAR